MSLFSVHVHKHLKDSQYYSHLHDKETIRQVKADLEIFRSTLDDLEKPIKKQDGTEMRLEEKQNDYSRVVHMIIYSTKGERYLTKADTIKKWMDEDKKLDERLEQVQIKTKYCNKCGQILVCTDKSYHGLDYKRIMFLYTCPDCKHIRAFFDNDEEYKPENRCKKCGKINESKVDKNEKRILIIDTCTSCGNIETHEFSNQETKDKAEEDRQKELEYRQFLADRENYCFSEAEGDGYRKFKAGLKEIEEIVGRNKEKEKNKALYDEVAKIQKLNIAQLNKLLSEGLTKENYLNLQFNNPEMARELIISFSIQENDLNRKQYDSEKQLRKIIESLLFNANWKLMSDGIKSRLGILYGRLKALEKEEDLLAWAKYRQNSKNMDSNF